MDTGTIDLILTNCLRNTNTLFLGVFPRDRIPSLSSVASYPACCVVNTDPHDQPGSHWVALNILSHRQVEFFDSYGQRPSAYALQLPPNVISNPYDFQSLTTDVCGHYCIYFLYHRAHNQSFQWIIATLSSYAHFSDSYVKLFVNQLVQSAHLSTPPSHCTGQCSICRCKSNKK